MLWVGSPTWNTLGSFEVMSNGGCLRELIEYPGISMVLYGFNGWPSLFNPWFRAERGWATYVDVTQSVSGVQLQDLDSTGQVIRFSPSAVPSDATPINRFLITYHRYDPANPWIRNWCCFGTRAMIGHPCQTTTRIAVFSQSLSNPPTGSASGKTLWTWGSRIHCWDSTVCSFANLALMENRIGGRTKDLVWAWLPSRCSLPPVRERISPSILIRTATSIPVVRTRITPEA
jgi:hypothetical protein